MQTGKLDQIIDVEVLSETIELGQVSRSYTPLGTFFAHVKTAKGKEAIEAARMNAKEVIRVLFRGGVGDITVRDRLEWNGRKYNVVTVDRTNIRKGELWLTAECVTKV